MRTSVWVGIFSIVSLLAPLPALAEKLPVFSIATNIDTAKAQTVFSDAFQSSAKPLPGNLIWQARNGKRSIEVDKRSGYFFLADEEVFLNTDINAKAPPESLARQVAETFLKRNVLLPQDQQIKVDFSSYSFTGVDVEVDGNKQSRVLDRHVNYGTSVVTGGRSIPVVGGGGQFKVVVGEGGRVIAFAGGWRPITGVADTVEIKSDKQALAEYMLLARNPKLRNIKMTLAYYAAPSFERQAYLAPVWVLSARIQAAAREMPLRIQIIPATKYGPDYGKLRPVFKQRSAGPKLQPDNQLPSEFSTNKSQTLLDLVIPMAHAQARREADSDCSTWWITDGLPQVYANRQGFINGCRGHGFAVTYDWGDINAWETDWTTYDDNEGADTADVAFYTGHADANGWVVSPPADSGVEFSEVGPDASGLDDRYGAFDLEHLIIAACGPHQSNSFVSGVGDATRRWKKIFNGLHTFSGYGSVTFDNDAEGRRFMELIHSGRDVLYSWIRTGIDVQPDNNGEAAPDGPRIFVTSMKSNHRTLSGVSSCIGHETMVVGGSGCADVRSSDVSIVFIYAGT